MDSYKPSYTIRLEQLKKLSELSKWRRKIKGSLILDRSGISL